MNDKRKSGPKGERMKWGEKKEQYGATLTPTARAWLDENGGFEVIEHLARGLWRLDKRPSVEQRQKVLEAKIKELIIEMESLKEP